MITWNETREKTAFNNGLTSQTSRFDAVTDGLTSFQSFEQCNSNNGVTTVNTYSACTSVSATNDYEGGFAYTYAAGTTSNLFGTSFTTVYGSSTAYQTALGSSADSDGVTHEITNTYSSSDSYSSTYSATGAQTATMVSTFTDTYTALQETTTNVSGERSIVSLSQTASGAPYFTVASTETVMSLAVTSATGTFTETVTSGISFTISAPVEIGTVASAESNEWLWSYTASPALTDAPGPTEDFFTNQATSFSTATFWPTVTAEPIDYATAGNDPALTSFSAGGFVETLTIEGISTVTFEETVTSGDYFSRDTITKTGISFSTFTSTETFGIASYSFSALSTVAVTFAMVSYVPATVHATAIDGDNTTETTLSSYQPQLTTYTDRAALNSYQASSSSASDSETTHFGQTISDTVTNNVAVFNNAYAEPATVIAPLAATGVFLPPGALAGGALYAWGTNLTFDRGQVPFPAVSSVFSNVGVPMEETASTTEISAGKTYTWRFSWQSDSLAFTKRNTYTSIVSAVTKTLTSSTAGTGTFATVGTVGDFVSQRTAGDVSTSATSVIFGGFADIGTAAETAYFGRNAVIGTSIDTDGSTSTYKTIRTAQESSTASGVMYVENNLPAGITYGGYGDALPVVAFERNGEG